MINPRYEQNGVWVYDIMVQEEALQAIVVRTPNGKADILQIKCRHGMLLCRAFDQELVERLDFPAAIFSAADCEAMLSKNPLYLSKTALEMGATLQMTGEQLGILFSQE